MELVESDVSLKQMVDQWQNQIGVLAKEKGLILTATIDSALPEKIRLDREKYTQIGINLLSNAIKFTASGSVTLRLEKQDSKLVLQVTDTGIGIPPHALNFIFDEFRQVDGSTSRVYGGNGLGLSIARRLSRLMDGNITVKSSPGQGSTFTVHIPLKLVSEEAIAPNTQPMLVTP